jgi:hypothetical protein
MFFSTKYSSPHTEHLKYYARRWVDHYKMELREIGWDGVDLTDVTRDQWRALVNTVLNLRVP